MLARSREVRILYKYIYKIIIIYILYYLISITLTEIGTSSNIKSDARLTTNDLEKHYVNMIQLNCLYIVRAKELT